MTISVFLLTNHNDNQKKVSICTQLRDDCSLVPENVALSYLEVNN